MIIGAHSIIYSSSPVVDREFLRDVLGLSHVDVGEGWLIFGLPPSEIAVHPSDDNDVHELYFMCADVQAFIDRMSEHGIACGEVQNAGWGLVTRITLPGGGKIGVYQPRHARPKPMALKKEAKTAKKRKVSAKRTKTTKKKKVARKKKSRRR